MSSPRNPKIPPPPLILPPSSSSPLSLSPPHPSPSLIPVSFFGSLQYSFSGVGTDHYGALDNPATLLHSRQPTTTHNTPANHPGPSLPTVRASRFIRDLPLPRTYRHPRHWFLVQAFSPVAHTRNCGAPCTFLRRHPRHPHSTSFHTLHSLRVAPFLIRSTLGPCQLHNQLFWSSLLLLCPDILFRIRLDVFVIYNLPLLHSDQRTSWY